MSNYFRWNAGRKRQGTPTLESQPGAHTGATRKYIPGYSDSNIVFLNTSKGNDANSGADIANAKLTYASAATAAGTTKKIRLVNSATLTANITKPTEATIGTTSTIQSSSLTAPVDTWSASATATANKTLIGCAWSPKLSKFVSVGRTSGSASYFTYSTNGTTWSESASTVASRNYETVIWCPYLEIFIAGGNTSSAYASFAYSTDGITWAESSSTFADTYITDLAWSPSLLRFVAVGSNGSSTASWCGYSSDGITWVNSSNVFSDTLYRGVEWSPELSMFVACGYKNGGDSRYAYSTDGITWTQSASAVSGRQVEMVAWSPSLAMFVAVGQITATGASYFTYSTNGTTWSESASTSATTAFNSVVWCPELALFVAAGADTAGNSNYAYSSNGTTWTDSATTTANLIVRDIAYSPLLGLFATAGNNGSTGAASYTYSTAYATTISASVAGFSIQAVQYSGTVTAYNCTLKQPGTTAALSLDSCRLTESGGHISNNAVTMTSTLVEGDIHYTGVYAAANALDLNLNTIAGTLYIYNGSTTNYERIRDNIIENGVRTSYPVTVTSGNTRGTSSDGTIFGQFCTTSDPLFVDETDYKLQRVLDGYQYDSPMVAASQYYYNQATTQTFRDNGAWSYNEGSATYKYQRTFNFLMPATAIGSAIDFVRHNRSNLHVAEDGTPDAVNTPDSRWEEIVMQFKTLPADHIDFINWLEGQVDMTCDISLSPSLTPTTAVTASGATAAGEAVITITDNSGIDSGDQLTIDGNTYTVLYTYGTTKVVLDRVTTTALTDTESITVKYDTGFGEYQYVPMLERRLSRWYETDENYIRGLQIRFARKLP